MTPTKVIPGNINTQVKHKSITPLWLELNSGLWICVDFNIEICIPSNEKQRVWIQNHANLTFFYFTSNSSRKLPVWFIISEHMALN